MQAFPTFSSVSLPSPLLWNPRTLSGWKSLRRQDCKQCEWQSQLNVKIGENTVASIKILLRNFPIFTLSALRNIYSELTLYQSSEMSSSRVCCRPQESGQTSVLITSSKMCTLVITRWVWLPGTSHWAASFKHTGAGDLWFRRLEASPCIFYFSLKYSE